MKVIRIVSPELDNNTYVLVGESVVMIDPSTAVDAILEAAKKYQPVFIILTHGHFDHKHSLDKVKALTKAKTVVHRLEGINADILVENGSIIKAGDIRLKVLHTPGHTRGSICLLEEGSKFLFSGDTLFAHGIFGRVDLPGGSLGEMINSLKRLTELDAAMLYPGHGVPVKNPRKHALLALKRAQQLIT